MDFFPRVMSFLRVWLVALVSSFVFVSGLAAPDHAKAHEIQPAIFDFEVQGESIAIDIQLTLESAVAGLDLRGLFDTNESERGEEYGRLRTLDPVQFENAFRRYWPTMQEKLTLSVDGDELDAEIKVVEIPPVGNIELARSSRITLSVGIPSGGGALVLGWTGDLGPMVVRQMGVEDGFTAFLQNGVLTDPIPLSGSSTETAASAFVDYIGVGFDHIIPLGLDHILFVLGLLFLALKIGPLLWQVTAFTLAHTVTLALGALEIVRIPSEIVEPIIAASIVYVGIENALSKGLTPWRPFVVFCFGLLHGLGFASVLSEFGLGSSYFIPKLIGFNVGVEIGQLAVIAAAYLTVGWIFAKYGWYKARMAAPVSVAIAVIALFWVFERTGVIGTDGIWGPLAAITEGGMPVLWGAGVSAAIIGALTVGVITNGDERLRDAGGFATSFVAFIAVTGAFTAGTYWIMAALVVLWVVAIRAQALGGFDGGGTILADA